MKRIIAALVAGALLVGGAVTAAAFSTPTVATAQETTDESTETAPDRGAILDEVLDALVADGTLTRAQADTVKEALEQRISELPRRFGARGFGHHGAFGHLEGAADVIGVTVDELRTALRDGQSLADVANANGMDTDTLVAELVALAEARIAEAEADGAISADKAEDIRGQLTDRITNLVNRTFDDLDRGFGRRNVDGAGRFGPPPEAPAGAEV